jgi:hypothetical protein
MNKSFIMIKCCSIWLLVHFVCRLYAQDAVVEQDTLQLFQKILLPKLKKLISNAKQLSATDSSAALTLLRTAAVKANRQKIAYLEANAIF